MAHVRHHRSQPWLTARCPAPRELPRGRQGQIPHPRQSLPLAGRESSAPARRPLPLALFPAPPPTARRIVLADLPPRRGSQRRRDLVLALVVARLLDPA